jgi:pimeloyl-ACP methyl ester carboxylesterase
MVNTTANDKAGYQLALDDSAQRGDEATVVRLRANGPPPYTGQGLVYRYVDFLDVLNDYLGAARYSVVVPIVPFLAPEYWFMNKVNHTRGLIDSFNVVYPQLADLDFRTQANQLEVPVYFLVGRDDVNAMASLVEDYHANLSAPQKLIWLQGGHGLTGAARGQFVDVMVGEVRPLAG